MQNAEITPYGTTSAGTPVRRITLRNAGGLSAHILDYGGIVAELHAPDRTGALSNIVLGCRNIADYEAKSPYFGALVGRYANRIGNARFTLDGATYHLPANNGPNTLHGGPTTGPSPNFSHRIWDIVSADAASVALRLTSPDGDCGFPGTLTVEVAYTLGAGNALRIDYTAMVEGAPTVLNLTNHTYFNLASGGSALDHVVAIPAARYLPTDAGQIPTGSIDKVENTPMDFRIPTPAGARIRAGFDQLAMAGGYDHCYVLDKPEAALGPAATLHDPASGRTLRIETTEPAVQFYTGNKLDGTIVGSQGSLYRAGDGLAFETQHFPDAPNHPLFPSTRLDPGQTFRSATIWHFGTS